MRYSVDTADALENTNDYVLVPEGVFGAEIIEVGDKKTSNGDPMANVKYKLLDGGQRGRTLYDNIVIPIPGSPAFKIMGRTMHFLHVIGQPYEGTFTVDTDKWVGQRLRVLVKHKLQKVGKYAGQMQANVNGHDFIDGKETDEIAF